MENVLKTFLFGIFSAAITSSSFKMTLANKIICVAAFEKRIINTTDLSPQILYALRKILLISSCLILSKLLDREWMEWLE